MKIFIGRNQNGQLGNGDTVTKDNPVAISALSEMNVIGAACGRNHTLFLTGNFLKFHTKTIVIIFFV